LAIKDSSVVVSLGRKKAILHEIEGAKNLSVGDMISVKNKKASMEKSKQIERS
jgi:hypothetical protein